MAQTLGLSRLVSASSTKICIIKILNFGTPKIPKRDTSSNDTLSTTTLRLKFLSNYQFVEKSVR